MAASRTVASVAYSLRETNPALAAQLGLAAYRLSPTGEARNGLLHTFAVPYATRLTGPTNNVESVAVSGDLVASGSQDRQVRLWDISNPYRPKQLYEKIITGGVWSVAFSPDGQTLAVASADYMVHLLDVSNPRNIVERQRLKGHSGEVTTLAYGPEGAYSVSFSNPHLQSRLSTNHRSRLVPPRQRRSLHPTMPSRITFRYAKARVSVRSKAHNRLL